MGDSNSAASVAQLVEHVHVHVYTCTLYMYIHVHCTCTMYSVHLEHIELVQVKSHFRQLWNLGSVLRFSESVNVSCTLVHSAVYMYMYMYSTCQKNVSKNVRYRFVKRYLPCGFVAVFDSRAVRF